MAGLYKRMTYVTLDEYGVDSLKDRALNIIDQIEDFQEITVGIEMEANLPLISYNFYGNKDLWWIITAYNAILDINEVTPGTVLQIPSPQALSAVLVEALQEDIISETGTEF